MGIFEDRAKERKAAGGIFAEEASDLINKNRDIGLHGIAELNTLPADLAQTDIDMDGRLSRAVRIGATLDITPSEAFDNDENYVRELQSRGINTSEKILPAFKAGIGDVIYDAGTISHLMGNHTLGMAFQEYGRRLRVGYQAPQGLSDSTWENMFKAEWWATRATRTIPFALSLIPGGIAGGVGAAKIAAKFSMGRFGRVVLGSLGGTAARRPLEAAFEAANTYDTAIAEGKTDAEARAAADFTFKANLSLAVTDMGEIITAFLPLDAVSKAATKTLIRRILTVAGKTAGIALLEAGEEATQDIIQRIALGEDIELDQRITESMALGAILGAGIGGPLSVIGTLTKRVENNMPARMKTDYDAHVRERNKALAKEGLSEAEKDAVARKQALDEIARTEEGEQVIKESTKDIKDLVTGQATSEEVRQRETERKAELQEKLTEADVKRQAEELGGIPTEGLKGEQELPLGEKERPDRKNITKEGGTIFRAGKPVKFLEGGEEGFFFSGSEKVAKTFGEDVREFEAKGNFKIVEESSFQTKESFGIEDEITQAKEEGFDGVVFKRFIDLPTEMMETLSREKLLEFQDDIVVVFKEQNFSEIAKKEVTEKPKKKAKAIVTELTAKEIKKQIQDSIKKRKAQDIELSQRKFTVQNIKRRLPVALRGQFLSNIATARTPAQLGKVFDRIDKEVGKFEALQQEAKVKGAIKAKISFIKKIGEFNQTVIKDVKSQTGINKPINKMTEDELNTVLEVLRERLSFKSKRGAIKNKNTQPSAISPEQYRENRILNANRKKGFAESAKHIIKDAGKQADKILGVISTRLKHIDPSLKRAIRDFEIKIKFQNKVDLEIAAKYLEKLKDMTSADFADIDMALKNGDIETINKFNKKYNMTKEYEATKKVFDDTYKRSQAVGFDIGYRENYFPRVIKDPEGLMEYLVGRDDFSILDEAISRKENDLGRFLAVDEKANLINNMIRGYSGGQITLSETGAMKARKIDFIDAELNQFYADSKTALIHYISKTNEAIEARKLFGKSRPVDKLTDEFNNVEDSIGSYMAQLLADGKIKASQEKEVRDILFARLTSTGTSGAIGLFKNLGHLTVMGSFANAARQIGDLAFAIYNSPVDALPATLKAIVGESEITEKDLGINHIAVEFSDNSRASKAVDRVFRLIGLTKIDSIGKQALINSSISKYQRLAKNPDAKFLKDMNEIFGAETEQLLTDLKSGEITENVKYLALNELLDFQPVALSEVPEQYLRSKNGKIFYTLKTWTIKMFDVYRNEAFDTMKTDKAQGIRNLIWLTSALVIMNATADEIIDLMLNRETNLKDRTIDNFIKLIGFTRYSFFQIQRDGLGSTIAEQILPPTAIINNISKDVITLFKDYDSSIDVSEFKTIQNIPVGGKLYYWWLGKGSKKGVKKSEEKVSEKVKI